MGTPRFRHFPVALWAGVAVGIALVAAIVTHTLETSRVAHREQASVEAWSDARVLEHDLERYFERIHLALTVLAEDYERELARPVPDLAVVTRRALMLQAELPDLDTLRVSDAAGNLVAGGGVRPSTRVNIADRAHFIALRDDPARRFAHSAPLVTRLTGRRAIMVARQVRFADGRFAGIAVTAIPIEQIEETLAAPGSGPGGTASLRGADLSLIARFPPVPEGGSDAPPEALRSALAGGERHGTFVVPSPIDGIERTYAFRRMAHDGSVLLVGRAAKETLLRFEHDARLVLGAAIALGGVLVLAAALVHRAWDRQRAATEDYARLARTDSLTGLANRRHFFERAEDELERSRRYATPVAVLMLDLDRFKAVNDTHGHRTGDLVLRNLATVLSRELRAVDTAGRVGGEEFAVLLPQTDLAEARQTAERLRLAVAASPTPRPEGRPVPVTISVGVASSLGDLNLDTLVNHADEALYEAKREGRDRVRCWPLGRVGIDTISAHRVEMDRGPGTAA